MSRRKTQNKTNIILERISTYYHLKDDTEIGDFYGVNKTTVSSWRTRNKINEKLIKAKCNDENLANWFLHGIECKGSTKEKLLPSHVPDQTKSNLVSLGSTSKSPDLIDEGELIKRALNVLQSDTPFRDALKENIISFDYAVECVRNLNSANQRIDMLEKRLKAVEAKLLETEES